MAWDFSIEPEFQAQLDWMSPFVREQARERFAWLLEAVTSNDG